MKILIVEDDPMVASLNSRFIKTLDQFELAGIANNAEEALTFLEQYPVDLVLLDIYLPDMNGLVLLEKIRSLKYPVDVLVVSAARDSQSISLALRNGAVDYLIKPFDFDRLRQALFAYSSRTRMIRDRDKLTQQELDQTILAVDNIPTAENEVLPKGLDRFTLEKIRQGALDNAGPFTTEELSKRVGISRVSVRKYLEFLCETGFLRRDVVYGTVGRPVYQFHTT